VVCDESSILKSFDGQRRAVKSPSSCARSLSPAVHRDCGAERLHRARHLERGTRAARLHGHAAPLLQERPEQLSHRHRGKGYLGSANEVALQRPRREPFWQWVCSWGRAIRRPSDLGFDDRNFVLPPLIEREHVVATKTLAMGMLFALPAEDLKEHARNAAGRSRNAAKSRRARLTPGAGPYLVPPERRRQPARRTHPDAEQVSGDDTDEAKEEKFLGFARGQIACS
jgi:hypothetical protein